MQIEIDNHSGFCFGVQRAIDIADQILSQGTKLYCLGDIVHNHEEVNRLNYSGMKTISHLEAEQISDETILLRSHGEAPTTYTTLAKNRNKVIDATCPVVLKLQQRIKKSYANLEKVNGQLVIFGKKGHPEVVGLTGQTNNRAIIVSEHSDFDHLDFNRPIELYSQTTMPLEAFHAISSELKKRAKAKLIIHDTICRQVANRVPQIRKFATEHEIILFVSGKKSANGKFLYDVCKQSNPNTYFISAPDEVDQKWFEGKENIGISGATSTPQWLMEKVKQFISENNK